ncbi:hypothetical protein ACIQNV_28325 [Streptomyces hydrogenans]|uniref:phage tail protein n=1 Tax=Streptomyces hydrogenans TaxID=1873719 RepID=UPI0034190968
MKEVPEKKPTHDHRTGPDGPAPRTEAPGPSGGLAPHQVQRLQGAVGNAAVARLVAQRYTAPVKTPPNAAPGFRRVGADVAAKKRTMAAHQPAAAESKSAQDAAVAPPDDKEAQGKAANAEKMNAAKPGEFDKAAFVAAVDKAIEAQAPKNLDEADKFSKSGKADKVKDEVDGKVTDGKNTSAKDIETTTKAPPDTSAAKDKPVTPMTPDNAPGNPGAPSAADAIPEKQPPAVTDFSQGPAENDKAMADAEVTEEQLAKGNEPEFDDALKAKRTAETDSAKAPGKAHTAEDQQLATAKAGAAAAGAQAMNTLTATRAAAGKAVDGGKGETKSKDERKRAEVTAKLQKVFDATKKDVETTLTGLDQKVDTAFTTGEKSARDAFTADHKARMKKYKDKRYGGFLGKGRWLKDKFAGMPQEANDLYQESRKLYVARMRTVISSVADMIGVELGRAKARIAQGRTDLKAEVDKLPADLKSFGEEAQQDFAGKFEDLEASVDEKSQQLVQDLANKYTAALNAVDEEIKKLQEANKGLIDKAKDAIVGVIKTINELKNLLLGILAKAASAIMKIIKDPIGFLGNLVKAVGAGLNLFVANIGDHLKKGLVSWLLGTATKAGLEIPERFDLRGIITLITSLLGLTWDNIRTRITRKGVPEEAMTAVETSVPVAQSLAKEGPAGAVKEIEAEAGDLKSTILSKLTEYLVPTVIIAGVTWILSLLNPASAFVRAVKGIIDIVTFVVNQGAQIADFVNAVLDAVIEIANGGAAGVPKMVETALAASIPLLIGFLASLLGIGNLANKVKSVFQAVSKPVNRAIDKIVDFIAKKGKALWQKLKARTRGGDDSPAGKQQRLDKALRAAVTAVNKYSGRPVARAVLRPLLSGIRARYGLQMLEPFAKEGKWSVRGRVNPEGTLSTGALTDREKLVGKQFVKHGEVLIGKVHDDWCKMQLSHPEVKNGKIWDAPAAMLDATAVTARQHLKDESAYRRITAAYYPDESTDPLKPYFYTQVFGKDKEDRKTVVDLLGRGALNTIRNVGASKADGAQDVDVAKLIRKMKFKSDRDHYGKFMPFPKGTKEPNEKLKEAIKSIQEPPRERIIVFLRNVMRGVTVKGVDWAFFKNLWDTHGNSKEYVKTKFREADPGKHEWIPTNYIDKVMSHAVDHREARRLQEALEWMELHHVLRSFTSDVIYRIEIPPGTRLATRGAINAHVGAFISVGDRENTFNDGDGPWHKGLRDIFDEFVKEHPRGLASEFLDKLQERMPPPGTKPEVERLIWDPGVRPISSELADVTVDAIYRHIVVDEDDEVSTVERVRIKMEDLEGFQVENYARVIADFERARTAISRRLV